MEQRLEAAAREGDIDDLYSLMKEDAYLLDRVENIPFIDTPLHIATSAGQVHFAMEIMRLKPSFARKLNQNGYSPIHLALHNEQSKLVLRLLDVDRDLVGVQGREGKTPLHFAAECGMVDLLNVFLSVCPKSIQDLTIRRETALHVSIKSDKLEAFKVLLGWLEEVGKDEVLKWCDDEGNTVLHVAASRNQTEVVNLIIARGVDVNTINMAGMTALDVSQQLNEMGNPEIRDSLIEAGALVAASLPRLNCSVQYLGRDERLRNAAKAGDTNILYCLIQEDPYILQRFDDIPYVDTPLHIAARLGHYNFVSEIMRWKPSFAKKPNQQGLYPVHLATINGHIQILTQLLSYDEGLVRLEGTEGKTSLHYAAKKGDTFLLDLLLLFCPLSIVDVTDQGDTALHVALKNSKLEAFFHLLTILEITFDEGSKEQKTNILNSRDERGDTVLHIAVQMNQPQVVKELINSGVEVNVRNAEDLTALDVLGACQLEPENTEIREMLLANRSGPPSVPSFATSMDNWISKTSMMERIVASIMRYKRDISSESRNLLLVVSVLIATITYQTAVAPPTSNDEKSIYFILSGPINSSSPNNTITYSTNEPENHPTDNWPFWTSNILALLSSLLTIFFLLPSKYTRSLLSVPLYFFVYCYIVTIGITGSWLWCGITGGLSVTFYCMLMYVHRVSIRVKTKNLLDFSYRKRMSQYQLQVK